MRILIVLFALVMMWAYAPAALADEGEYPQEFLDAIRRYECERYYPMCVGLVSGSRVRVEPSPEKRSADFPETPYNYPTSWPSAPPSLDRLAWDAYWSSHPNVPTQPTISSSIRPPAAGSGGIR